MRVSILFLIALGNSSIICLLGLILGKIYLVESPRTCYIREKYDEFILNCEYISKINRIIIYITYSGTEDPSTIVEINKDYYMTLIQSLIHCLKPLQNICRG